MRFDIFAFVPHRSCLLDDERLIMIMNIGNGAIALSYYLIPVALVFICRRGLHKLKIDALATLLLYAAFIVSCGATHIMDIIVIYFPIYWLQAVFVVITALVSLPAAVVTIHMLIRFMRASKQWTISTKP